MKKKYYKIVHCFKDEKGFSYYSWGDPNEIVEYKFNEWVEAPEGTRLFVFDNLKEALESRFRQNDVIFECEIVGGIKGKGAYFITGQEKFWEMFNSFIKRKKKVDFDLIGIQILLTFVSAVLTKKVKLVKEIKL
jgi:hypothetical protein